MGGAPLRDGRDGSRPRARVRVCFVSSTRQRVRGGCGGPSSSSQRETRPRWTLRRPPTPLRTHTTRRTHPHAPHAPA
eukprot:5001973-Prymnesium_polylepis.1